MGIKRKIVVLLFFSCSCFAQKNSLTNTYIQKFPEKISVQLFTLNTSNDFTVEYQNPDLTVNLEPNYKTTLGLAVQYDIISFSFGFAPKFFADNKDNKDSKMTSFGFSLFPGRWMQHFDYYYQKGISLETEGADLYISDLKTMKLGGSTSYIFNKKFSFKALSFQSERQLKSAGSFIPSLTYYYMELSGGDSQGINGKTSYIDVALSPGYSYNWVVAKKFLIAGGAFVGCGFTKAKDNNLEDTAFLAQASLTVSLGYNSETFYGGLMSKVIVTNRDTQNEVNMGDTINYATLFLGYRFDAPGFLTKEKNKIKSKF